MSSDFIPSFFDNFKVAEPEVAGLAVTAPPLPAAYKQLHKKSFTVRDWDFLAALAGASDDRNQVEVSNAALAAHFGIGVSAASVRIKRLASLGLIEVRYEHATDTGRNNRRIITIIQLPSRPWSPE